MGVRRLRWASGSCTKGARIWLGAIRIDWKWPRASRRGSAGGAGCSEGAGCSGAGSNSRASKPASPRCPESPVAL